jgi:hypothetical protein
MVWTDEAVSYFTEHSQSYDKVLDIFIRANDGGTKLSKSDLLLSMLTSTWEVNAREQIFNFVEYINNDLILKNDFDKDFIMRSCLVLSDLPHVYKVANFTKENLDIIKSNWSEIKRTLKQTILIVNSFGLDRDLLTSANALHPIAYYLHKTGKTLGTAQSDVHNSKQIHRWLLISLLNNIFGGHADTIIGSSRDIVKNALRKSSDFPSDSLLIGLKTQGKYSSLNDDFIDDIMQLTYSKRTVFLALSLIQAEAGIGNNLCHIDHIFPKSWFTIAYLHRMGISDNQIITDYQKYANNIANLQILSARENQEKYNQPLEEWLAVRDDDFKRKHCIPTNHQLYKIENFLLFISERKKLIETTFKSIFNNKFKDVSNSQIL